MSEVSLSLDPETPPPKPPKRKRKKPSAGDQEKSHRRALISSIVIGSVVVHVIALLLFGLWTVAKHFTRPEARFEMKKLVKIPPKTPEHKMNVAKHEAMTPKPTFNDKLISTRPIDFALPDLPQVDMDQMLPLDPSELISDQVSSLVGSAALGSGMGTGMGGGGGTGKGMSLFGVPATGERILLLFDVAISVVNKAEASGVPFDKVKEETVKFVDSLPISSQFSLIQFTGNYMEFTEELIAATPGNKKLAKQWIEDKWTTAGGLSSAAAGVTQNFRGVIGVLERGLEMRPDVIFIISDASFNWRPGGGNGYPAIPYDEFKKVVEKIEEESRGSIPIHLFAFQPRDEDAKALSRIIRKTGGEFKELKEK